VTPHSEHKLPLALASEGDSRQAEQALRQSEERCRVLLALLRRREAEDELITKILSRLATCRSSAIDASITDALRAVAEFIGVDHAYFVRASADRTGWRFSHEWCGPQVASQLGVYRSVPFGTLAWSESRLLAGEPVRINSLEDYPPDAVAERQAPERDPGRCSLLNVPTRDTTGAFAGVVGLDSYAQPVSWSDNDVTVCRIVGNAVAGVLERQRAAQAREDSERQYRELYESVRDGFAAADMQGQFSECNSAFRAMLGYSEEELRSLTYPQITPAKWHAHEAKIVAEQVMVRGYSDPYEKECRRKDGTLFPVELQAYLRRDAGGVPVGFWALVRDITERRRAEAALRQSERKYRALVETTNTGYGILGADGALLDANAEYVHLTGHERLEEILGRPVTDWTAASQTERNAAAVRRCFAEGFLRGFEVDYVGPKGQTIPVEINATAVCTESRKEILALCRDITVRKEAEAERNRLMAEAQAANSAKDQFLAVLSHELRNPLAAINAGFELLRRSGVADEPQAKRALEVIGRNAKLQARLVNDLLDLSRIVRGKITLQRSSVQLDDVVSSAVQACGADAERAKVSLQVQAASGLWVDADSDRLQQIVINLVSNAVKFTPGGGHVTASVLAKDGRGLVVVEDSGIGIEASRLTGLFQMFQQGQVGAQRAPGLGIGLALVKSLTEMHGGRVWAESAGPGLGSRFTVELPLCEEALARLAHEASPRGGRPIRVLLVEDNPDTRTMLAETLGLLAYHVVPAESGEAALDILAREPVDVIVADIGLPGMDGYEFLRRAHGLPSAGALPAFAVTGYGRQTDARRALDAGYVAHFVKPIDLAVLDQQIREMLGEARSLAH
jgi:two-component system, chemotaxis family, CheB/CheR fusion protein